MAPVRVTLCADANLVAVDALPDNAPVNVVAVTTFPVVIVTLLMESVPDADSIILEV